MSHEWQTECTSNPTIISHWSVQHDSWKGRTFACTKMCLLMTFFQTGQPDHVNQRQVAQIGGTRSQGLATPWHMVARIIHIIRVSALDFHDFLYVYIKENRKLLLCWQKVSYEKTQVSPRFLKPATNFLGAPTWKNLSGPGHPPAELEVIHMSQGLNSLYWGWSSNL